MAKKINVPPAAAAAGEKNLPPAAQRTKAETEVSLDEWINARLLVKYLERQDRAERGNR